MSRPAWLGEVIDATEHWLTKIGGDSKTDSAKPAKIGRVRPDPEDPGWYSLTLRGRTVDSDQLEEAFLAPAQGPDAVKYGVRDSVQDGDVLRVLVMAGAPPEGLFLWAPARSRTALLKALVERLREVGSEGIHEAFGKGRLDAVEPCRDKPAALDADQQHAFEACVGAGLNLVWGPPGTGKTEVIARAVEYLVRNGKSVLLVSGTNVAVDNALLRAAKRTLRADEQGVMIRVGTPHVPDVAADPRLSLAELRKQRLRAKEEERAAVEAQIVELEEAPEIRRLADAEERLRDFDPQSYANAEQRIENKKRLTQAEGRYAEAEHKRTEQERAVEEATRRLAAARSRWADSAAQREALATAQKLTAELDGYRLAHARAKTAVMDAEAQLKTARQELATRSMRARRRRRKAGQRIAEATTTLSKSAAAVAQHDEILRTAGPVITQQIARATAEAGSMTPELAAQLGTELRESEEKFRAAEELRSIANDAVARLRHAVDQAASAPQPTAADRDLVERAKAEALPGLHRSLPQLQSAAARVKQQIDTLTNRHERLVKELRELARDAERAILAEAKLVATTLTMMRLKRAIYGRPYDVVIIDEAAASPLPELVHAVSLAGTGAVMLGDFLQNAPILEGVDRSPKPTVKTWLANDCFAFFGVTGARTATGGCVTLTSQRRFGPAINELANLVAYDGILRAAGSRSSRVVFIDVDGLGDEYVKVRDNPSGSGKWWVIGALLARAITEYHVAVHGESGAGVVTPYRIQKDIIDSMLADAGASERIEVSTSHGFQGREFDTIVFDLVEDGRGWVAKGSKDGDGYAFNGLRLFNVGVTRARVNLYVIGNGAALGGASGGPLHALKQLIEQGRIEVVAARDILGMPKPQIQQSAAFELWDAVRTYVKVVGIYDEDVLPQELIERIREANGHVWVWSPWVGRRVDDFLPALQDAADRGVRVSVMVLPTDEVGSPLHKFVNRLRQHVDHVVFVKKEHQKLVIIDDRLTFIGSMNVLSHPGGSAGRREVMTLIESADFAKRMLQHERADQFDRPPSCPSCQSTMRAAALHGSGRERSWQWWCYNPRPNGSVCKGSKPFPKQPAGRNQRPYPRPAR